MSLRAQTPKGRDIVIEPPRQIRVGDEVDVLVAGGGLGGVSAAVAAGRAGARTLLVERNGYPGGVATAGMCCSVFNCFYTPSHELVVRGNALEFVDELAKAEGPGSAWHDHKGHIIYDVERAKLALIELLEAAGVSCLFDTLIAGAIVDGNTLRGVTIESKSGREAVLAVALVVTTAGMGFVLVIPLLIVVSLGPVSICFFARKRSKALGVSPWRAVLAYVVVVLVANVIYFPLSVGYAALVGAL